MKHKYGINNIKELFLALLPAQIFSNLTSSLSGIVNGIIIGNFLSSLDMIALGFASPAVAIIGMSSSIVASGARILCGKYVGKGEKEGINKTFTSSIILLLLIGVLLTLLCFVVPEKIASLFGASLEAIDKTSLYIKGVGIGIIPTIISPCLMVFLQMENESNYALFSTLLLAVLNFILNLVAMRYMNIGIFGVGVVTSIAQYLVLGFLCLRFIRNKSLAHLVRVDDKKIFRNILVFGLPSALAGALYAIRNSRLNVIASDVYGDAAVNALSILNSSAGPLDAFNIGLGATQLMLASIFIGEKDKEAVKTLSILSLTWGMVMAFIKVILIFLFADKIALFFGANAEVMNLTVNLYRHYGITMPVNIITLVLINTHQAFGRVTMCNIVYILSAFVAPITIAKVFGSFFGINAVWSVYWAAEVIAIVTIYIMVCIKKKEIIKKPMDLLMVDESIDNGNSIYISINSSDEISKIAQTVQEYCLSENIDRRRSMMAGLCCEEIVSNTIEHGFPKTKKNKKMVDVFVDVDDNQVNIHIKDNAISFDPHTKIYESNDPTTNIGIRMVSKISSEMNYQNMFGINVLSIKL